MKTYQNVGLEPLNFSLQSGGEYLISPGEKVELPENDYILGLVARRHLSEVSPEPKTNPKTPK